MNALQRIASTMAALGVAIVACAQWSFTVDPTFQTQIVQQNVNDLAILEDGKIFISGRIRFPGDQSDRGSAKLLSTGERDVSFPAFPQTTGGGKLTPWNGMYYVSNGLVRRLTGQGLIDPTFISINLGPYFNSLQGGDYHVFPDGRVLISGNHQLNDSIRGFVGRHQLIWFSNTGYLDTTRTHRSGGNCAVYRFRELPNGQFICSGLCNQFDGHEVDRIFRVNADGSVDTTFRTGVYGGSALAYLPLPDGRVYTGGNFRRSAAPTDTLRLVRFMPDGSLDPTFSIPQFNDGTLNWSGGAGITNIQTWSTGIIMATGQFRYVNGQQRNGICLFDSTGQLMDAFSGQGVGIFETQSLDYASVDHTVFDSLNSSLYICGAYSGYNDGLTNYPEQRFITRLNVQELSVGMQEQEPPAKPRTSAFGVYPNPTRDQVVLRYDFGAQATQLRAELRDAVGRIVATIPLDGATGQKVFDTTQLAPGTYLVQYLGAGGLAGTVPLVIQR